LKNQIDWESQGVALSTLLDRGIDIISRRVQLVGEVNSDMFIRVDTALSLLKDKKNPVTFIINSEGGHVSDALGIVGRMEASGMRIITEGYGVVESAATMILAAGTKRRMARTCRLMHHEGSYNMEGAHDSIKHLVEEFDKNERMWCDLLGEYTKKNSDFWRTKGIGGKDYYISAQECLDYGVIDEII